jgi:hypothetical protein
VSYLRSWPRTCPRAATRCSSLVGRVERAGDDAELVESHGGTVGYRKTAEEVPSNRTLMEFTWNHTTLHALKIDKT